MEQGNAIIDRSDMRKKAFSFAIKIGYCCRFILGWGLFYIIILLNNLPVRSGELGVNLVVKSWISTWSIGCSSIGQVLGTQYPHTNSQPSVILVTGYQCSLSWPRAHQTHIWRTDMHAGNKFTVKKKINLIFKVAYFCLGRSHNGQRTHCSIQSYDSDILSKDRKVWGLHVLPVLGIQEGAWKAKFPIWLIILVHSGFNWMHLCY